MRLLILFVASIFSLTSIALALEVPEVDLQLKSQGFEGNLKALKRGDDHFYEAFKVQGDRWRGVTVSAFTDSKKSTHVKQLRWVALNCTFSKVSDSTVLEAFQTELKKAFQPLFGVELPKSLETWLTGTAKEGTLTEKGFRKIRLTRYAGYCDSTKGGISLTIDLFPEAKPASETTPQASPAGS